MIEHVHRFTLPAAFALLPPPMTSREASASVLTIGLQETGFLERRQREGGPARSFWQFEINGINGVLHHPASSTYIDVALRELRYSGAVGNAAMCHALVEDNDTLACVFARLLLRTLRPPLATRVQPDVAWIQYLDAWRPGRYPRGTPMPDAWVARFAEAWSRVDRFGP